MLLNWFIEDSPHFDIRTDVRAFWHRGAWQNVIPYSWPCDHSQLRCCKQKDDCFMVLIWLYNFICHRWKIVCIVVLSIHFEGGDIAVSGTAVFCDPLLNMWSGTIFGNGGSWWLLSFGSYWEELYCGHTLISYRLRHDGNAFAGVQRKSSTDIWERINPKQLILPITGRGLILRLSDDLGGCCFPFVACRPYGLGLLATDLRNIQLSAALDYRRDVHDCTSILTILL